MMHAEDETHLDVAKLRALREGLGLTQGQAGEAAGFKNGRQSWNHFESGRQATISLATLWKLAKVLRVQARDLLKPGPPIEDLSAANGQVHGTREKAKEFGDKTRLRRLKKDSGDQAVRPAKKNK